MKFLRALFIVFSFNLCMSNHLNSSEQKTKELMKADLDVIQNIFEVYYAPKDWKKQYFNWDLAIEIQKAKDKVQTIENISTKTFQYIVRDFFHSAKDYHVGVKFYSTESSTLPFNVRAFDGKYYISSIDYSRLDTSVYFLNIGDEVVIFDNSPIEEVIKELKIDVTANSNSDTDDQLTAFYLTHRSGQLGHRIPRGNILIGTQSIFSNEIKMIQLLWDYVPEKISNRFENSLLSSKKEDEKFIKNLSIFDKLMTMEGYSTIVSLQRSQNHEEDESKGDYDDDEDDSQNFIGARNTFLPPLGKIWWESSKYSPFQAYIYESMDHKLIGFIRIGNYYGGNMEAEEFASIISLFNERTDALVIDQMNNPGGLLLYAYGLLSMLTEKPLTVPKEREMITQKEVAIALEVIKILETVKSNSDAQLFLGSDVAGMPITYQMSQRLLAYFHHLVSEWESGRTFTEPYPMLGFDHVLPNPMVRYTKPILFLVNNLDFSCGDYVPAILQDNKRATLLGTRTAGAGGYVTMSTFPSLQGISFITLTASIAARADNQPIENLGVTPDIEYKSSLEDMLFGYLDFADQINFHLFNLIKAEQKKRELSNRKVDK